MFSVLEVAEAFEATTVARPEAAATVAADAVTNFLRESTALCSIPARADRCREQRAPTPPETFPEPVCRGSIDAEPRPVNGGFLQGVRGSRLTRRSSRPPR